MNIGTRKPRRKVRLAGALAILVPLTLVVLGVAAWRDAGVQPVQDLTVAVPLPGQEPAK